MRSLEEELEALAAMSATELKAEWQRVMRNPAPAVSTSLLERGLAYELQVKRHGGLPRTTRRIIERMSKELSVNGTVSTYADTTLRPGTRLSRDWHGRTHHVLVLEDGFLFEDRQYRSLSQIAAAITGTGWSGPRFFGLKRAAKAEEGRGG